MAKKITIDGQVLPITDGFSRDVVAPTRRRDFRMAALRNEITAMERKSERPFEGLSPEEEQLKGQLVKIWNVGNAIALLRGRQLSDFGFEGADQVHHRLHHLHCGCTVREIFDHHLAHAEVPHEHHAHFPDRVCASHRHLALDFRAHREKAVADHDLHQAEIEAARAIED